MTTCKTSTSDLLAEAEREYHDLVVGNKPAVVVDQNGERTEYTMANAPRLRRYIETLRAQLGQSRVPGPLGAIF